MKEDERVVGGCFSPPVFSNNIRASQIGNHSSSFPGKSHKNLGNHRLVNL